MKKGFTLIELLAVIVILAIIALIAVPTVTSVVERARMGGAKASAIGYADSIDNTIATNTLNKTSYDLKPGIYVLPLNNAFDIKVKGKAPTNGLIEIDKNGVSNYKVVIDDKYIVTKEDDKVSIEKKTKDIEIIPSTIYVATDNEIKTGDEIYSEFYCLVSASQNMNSCLDSGEGMLVSMVPEGSTYNDILNNIKSNASENGVDIPSDAILQKMLLSKKFNITIMSYASEEAKNKGTHGLGDIIYNQEQTLPSTSNNNLKSDLYAKLELDKNGKVTGISSCSKGLNKCFDGGKDFNSYKTDVLDSIGYDTNNWTKTHIVSEYGYEYDTWINNQDNGERVMIEDETVIANHFGYSISVLDAQLRINLSDDITGGSCTLSASNENVFYDCARGLQ